MNEQGKILVHKFDENKYSSSISIYLFIKSKLSILLVLFS